MTCPPQVERAEPAPAPVASVWDGVLRRLGRELSSFALEAWIGPLSLELADDGLRLVCPSAFHCERIRERYLARILEHAAQECGQAVAVTLVVRAVAAADGEGRGGAGHAPRARSDADPAARPRVFPVRSDEARREPAPPPEPRRPAPTGPRFDDFAAGASNALALEAARALAHGRQLAVSPLYVVAAVGLGKTHLASAVVAEVNGRGERAVYASGEQFTNELLSSIRAQRTAEFKRRYRECDVLVLEDVHFLRGKQSTQLELLHTLEHLARRGARVMLTADRLPREIPDLDPRLASRLASGLVAEVEAPDLELRRRIVRAKACAASITLPADCLERVVTAIPGSVRDLEAAIVQLAASASLLKRSIDLALVEAALRKVLPRLGARLDPERIAALVAAHFDTGADALASRSRRREILVPRQIAMYLCSRYTDSSLQRIGEAFRRNHPSVAHAVRAVERALAARAPMASRVAPLLAELDALSGGRRGPQRKR